MIVNILIKLTKHQLNRDNKKVKGNLIDIHIRFLKKNNKLI